MMSMLKKSISAFFAIALIVACSFVSINAEELYHYQVTIYAGSYGVFNDEDAVIIDSSSTGSSPIVTLNDQRSELTITGLKANDRIGLQTSKITVTNDKYYAKGMKIGGRDNEKSYILQWYTITKDSNYVVSYGIPGNQVEYTTYYVDQDGNQLREPETYYGTIGEYTVTGYKYVDGYLPQAYNLGKTLVENADDNTYTFVYTPIAPLTATTPTTGTTGTQTGGQTTTTGGATDGTTTAGGQTDGGQTTTDQDDTTTATEDQVEDIINLDEEETPLANGEDKTTSSNSNTTIYVAAGGGLLVIIALATILYRRKKNA